MSTTEQNTNVKLSPKQQEALDHYREWQNADPANRGGYSQFVAERMVNRTTGEPITVGRAGVYVREALAAFGEQPESTRASGTSTGGSRTGTRMRKPSTAEATMQASIAAYDESLARMRSRITEAQEAAEGLDQETFIHDRTEDLKGEITSMAEELKAKRAALKAWEDDKNAQTKAFEAERTRLQERVSKVQTEVEDAISQTEGERDKLVKAMEAITA